MLIHAWMHIVHYDWKFYLMLYIELGQNFRRQTKFCVVAEFWYQALVAIHF